MTLRNANLTWKAAALKNSVERQLVLHDAERAGFDNEKNRCVVLEPKPRDYV